MSRIVDTTAAFFRIKEKRFGNYVSVNPGGGVISYKETGGDEQAWLFLPAGADRYRIMNKRSGKYLACPSSRDLIEYDFRDEPGQLFSIVNDLADPAAGPSAGPLSIQSGIGNDFVAVGSGGNVLRWDKTNKSDQQFELVAIDPALTPSAQMAALVEAPLGGVPKITSMDASGLPEESEPVVVGKSLVLSTLVNDPRFSDKVEQMKSNPYYIAVHRQFWSRRDDRGYFYQHAKGESSTLAQRVVYEVTARSTRTSEDTWGWKFSINGGMGVSTPEASTGPALQATAGMAFEIARQMKTTIINDSSQYESNVESEERTYDRESPDFVIAAWTRVDRYSLYSPNDMTTPITEVEAGSNNSLVKDSFPGGAAS